MGQAQGAVRASDAAAAEAGAESAESVAVSCDLIRIGVFFDGTANSRQHVARDNISWHTNVDLLEHRYENTGSKVQREVLGQTRNVNYASTYQRGIGVNASGSGDWNGLGRGMGPEGVRQRAEQTVDELRGTINRMAGGMEVCDLWFDVFGFSRGAAAARHFSNLVEDDEIGIQDATARVKFLGLWDTVVMIGTGVATRGDDDNANMQTRNVADKIVHFTADDEIRDNFPLTFANSEVRYRIVGVHADIGGGYDPNLPADVAGSFEFEHEDYPGLPGWIQRKFGVRDGVAALDSESPDTISTELQGRWQVHDAGEPISTFNWSTVHGLQFVPLRLMYDEAVAAGVPFESWTDTIAGTNVALDESLSAYYGALKQNRNGIRTEMKDAIRHRYSHISFNANYSGPFQPNLPNANARRTTDRQ